MKKLVVIHSQQRINLEKEKEEFNSIMQNFEIEHLILSKKLRIPDDVGVIIFNDGIDCMQITEVINKTNNKIPMIRLYPLMYGYGEIENVSVFHTKDSVCKRAMDFLN